MTGTFLERVYDPDNPVRANDLYDAWASTYDEELRHNGYAAPARVAEALAKFARDPGETVLDFGCGTGLSGLALRDAGFDRLDGMDLSGEMLERAREKNIYRDLLLIGPEDRSPIPKDKYDMIAAIGVIGIGAAPPDLIDTLMRALPKGGLLGLTLNDHSLAAKIYEGAMCQWLDPGAARLLAKDHGQHLPGQNISSNVYIIEKK